jgi:hypothetical protein
MNNEIFIEEPNKAFHKAHVTSSATDNNWRKCKHCGKFISYKQMEEQKDVMFHFIPDSEVTTEEAYWVHRHCCQRAGLACSNGIPCCVSLVS